MTDAEAWSENFVPGVVPWPDDEGGITLDNNSGISSLSVAPEGGAGAEIVGPGGTRPPEDDSVIPDPGFTIAGGPEGDGEESGGSPAVITGGSPGESTGAAVLQTIRAAGEVSSGFDIMRFIPILAAAGIGVILYLWWKK